MPDINLLPWREELREERKRQFIVVICLCAALAAAISFAWGTWRSGLISSQTSRNNLLKQEISALDQKVAEIKDLKTKRVELIERMQVIKGLQTNRPEIVKLYDQIVRIIPDGVYLTDLQVNGNSIAIEGKAESNNRISSLLRKMDSSEKFNAPNLSQVTADRELGDQGGSFSITASILNKSTNEEEQ